ncbi:cupin domain [Trichoderma arundinaceum]|uniref:Cupin domain n=1 Tax=Trichoderma arundinaceum TaxID=490622 RepID=A0A395NEB7_TRIAR|nr:cupin domain [Trichoderma arundinaceum]
MSSTTGLASATAPAGLPPPRRVITTHNADGQAVFSEELSQHPPRFEIPDIHFYLCYTLNQSPGVLENNQDLKEYQDRLPHNVGLNIPGGTLLRVVDFLPGDAEGLMHRTKTVDFGVILEGELQLILGSGESTVLKRGDIVVQRGTIHAWKNNSATEVARAFFVLTDAVMPTINGTRLDEEVPIEELRSE